MNPDPTYGHQADRVSSFYQLVGSIRDKHASSQTDARHVNLNNIMMAANAAVTVLRLLQWAKTGGERVLIEALGLSRPDHISFVAEDLLRSVRLFLLLESQFQVETLFRNILIALRKKPEQGFYNLARQVLNAIGVSNPDQYHRVLNVGALLRNSMHANGVHYGFKGSSTVETVEGVRFEFTHGQRVQCGSWFHIVTAITASIGIVDEILSAADVRSLSTIPDAYASQHAMNNA